MMAAANAEIHNTPNRIVQGHTEPGAEVDNTVQCFGCRCLDRIGTEKRLDDFLQHNCQAERDQDLVSMRTFVKMADQSALHNIAQKQHNRNRSQNCQWNRPTDNPLSGSLAKPRFNIRRFNFQRITQKILLGFVQRDRSKDSEFSEV